MVLLRSAALRRPLTQRFTNTVRSSVRAAERPSWQRASGRRGYADAHGATKKEGSDLPWAIGAVVVTIPSVAYILTPGADAHKAGGHGDHGDSHGSSAPEEKEEEEPKEESTEESKEEPKSDDEEKSEDKPKPESDGEEEKAESKDEAKDESESKESESKESESKESESDEGKDEDASSDKKKAPKDEGKASDIKGERKKEPSSKSDTGEKRRIDSALRKPQGVAGDESKISDQQKGTSMAPTMHSTDQMKNPEQSKKAEGAPDTAKVPHPVDPSR